MAKQAQGSMAHRSFVLALAGLAAVCGCAVAQTRAADVKQQIIGGWRVVNVVLEQGGNRREPYGPSPRGFISYDADGNYVSLVTRGDLPKVASNNRETPTAEESKALAIGSWPGTASTASMTMAA